MDKPQWGHTGLIFWLSEKGVHEHTRQLDKVAWREVLNLSVNTDVVYEHLHVAYVGQWFLVAFVAVSFLGQPLKLCVQTYMYPALCLAASAPRLKVQKVLDKKY